MTSIENSNAGSPGLLDPLEQGDLERDIEQIVIENQQRAKELTQKAASESDPTEREALLRQALDHEVQARIQNEIPQELSVASPTGDFDQDETELALEIGPEALAGPLLDITSPIVLKEALIELDGGLNADAVGGFFVNLEDEGVKSGATSPVDEAVSLEPALPPIEEVLQGAVTPTDSQRTRVNVETDANVDQPETVVRAPESLQTPVDDAESTTDAGMSTSDELDPAMKPTSGQAVEIGDDTEVAIVKTEVVDTGSPVRKPRKLEIRAKKKPQKLEIRSPQQSP